MCKAKWTNWEQRYRGSRSGHTRAYLGDKQGLCTIISKNFLADLKLSPTITNHFKVEISTITKGVPIAKLELRHQRLTFAKNAQVSAKYSYIYIPRHYFPAKQKLTRTPEWSWTRRCRCFWGRTLLQLSSKHGGSHSQQWATHSRPSSPFNPWPCSMLPIDLLIITRK